MKIYAKSALLTETPVVLKWAGWWRIRGWSGGLFGLLSSVHLEGTDWRLFRIWILGPLTITLPLLGRQVSLSACLETCGTRFRGCDPACPRDVWHEKGAWIGPEYLRPGPDRATTLVTEG